MYLFHKNPTKLRSFVCLLYNTLFDLYVELKLVITVCLVCAAEFDSL